MNRWAQQLEDWQKRNRLSDATIEMMLRAFVLNDERGPEFIQFVTGVKDETNE